jgi:hypothetical protein
MGPISKKHSQRLKEEVWLLRLFSFCPSYTPSFLAVLLFPLEFSASL